MCSGDNGRDGLDNSDRPPEAGALLARTPVRLWRQYGADFLRSISIGSLDEVRVDAKGGRSIRVAHTSAYGSYRYALRQQTGCGEMPKIMEADGIPVRRLRRIRMNCLVTSLGTQGRPPSGSTEKT